jgi:signal transduction histidine kinase/DNA-binding NarL/FixJ family response regulator
VDDETTNILVVDDLPEKLLVYRSILEELGQTLVTARSGDAALREVLQHEFAVILLDVNMPGMNGLETAALIRRRRRSAHTPIIFLTAFSDEVRAAEGYAHGAVDYMSTPVVPEILRAKVRVFVDLYRMTQQVKRQAEERVVLAEERTKRAAAEEATRRSHFLAEVSRGLADSLDPAATAATLARQSVPFLADLAGVTLVGPPGVPWRTELAWTYPPDPTPHVLHLSAADAPRDGLRDAVDRALALGTAQRLDNLDVPYPEAAGITGPVGARVRTAVVVPLLARGRTLGALTLALGPSGRRHDPADVALAEDLASRAAIALDNARLYKEVETADRQKNEFLSMLAHELRNPLAPIRNAAEVLRLKGPEQPQIRWAREVIDRQTSHLVRLVDDLLDVSRITKGKIRLVCQPTDLGEVLAHAVEASRPLIEQSRHRLEVALPPAPVRLHGDPARLVQVFTNLLNNAAKYTEDGGQIWLSGAAEGVEAVVRVRDTGVGIPPDMLAAVFDLFIQADRSLERSQGGLGVGLTLVKRLVEKHGGRVEALSAGLGKGSEFVVRIPIQESPPADSPTPAADQRAAAPLPRPAATSAP